MSPFGIRRLISEIECPSYCEDSLLEAISEGDYATFKTICNNEKLTLTSELTAIVGFIIAFIKKPLEAFDYYKCKSQSAVSGNEKTHEVIFSLPTLENEPLFKWVSATIRSVFGEDKFRMDYRPSKC